MLSIFWRLKKLCMSSQLEIVPRRWSNMSHSLINVITTRCHNQNCFITKRLKFWTWTLHHITHKAGPDSIATHHVLLYFPHLAAWRFHQCHGIFFFKQPISRIYTYHPWQNGVSRLLFAGEAILILNKEKPHTCEWTVMELSRICTLELGSTACIRFLKNAPDFIVLAFLSENIFSRQTVLYLPFLSISFLYISAFSRSTTWAQSVNDHVQIIWSLYDET